jgi:hypothetical protein
MVHWKSFYSDYLGLHEYPEKAIIKSFSVQEIVMQAGIKKKCIVLFFEQNKKGLPLNATQCGDLQRITKSPDPEKWKGIEILIKPIEMKFFNKNKEVLRFKGLNEVATVKEEIIEEIEF